MENEQTKGYECRYMKQCEEKKYDQCYNHCHVLCEEFERIYDHYKKNLEDFLT